MTTQLCTFSVGELRLGIDVLHVQEVIREQVMTIVPRADPQVRGLINLRGQIVTALDLRRRLDLEPLDGDQTHMNVVVRCGESAVSLVVDEIGDVVEVTHDEFEPSPETLSPILAEALHGIYKLEHELLLHVDVDRVVEVNGHSAANAA